MGSVSWAARALVAAAPLASFLAAPPVAAVRVDFNPVTLFPVAEGSPNLVLSLSATLEGTDCQPSLLRSISGGLDFSLEELPGQATASLDFVGGVHGVAITEDRPGGVITIEFQAVLPGVILQDALDEPDEQIRLRLTGHTLVAVCTPGSPTDPAVTLAPTSATAIIQDDDSAVVVSYSLASGSYQVDDDQGQATVGVVVSGPPDDSCGALGFHYRVSAGTAETGDFTPVVDQELALPAGSTQASIPVAIFPDSDLDDETVIVEIFQPKAASCDASLTDPTQAIVTLRDSDAAPGPIEIRLGADAVALDETAGSIVVPALRAPVDARGVGVHYRVRAGTAEAGDFTAVADGVLEFGPGEAEPGAPLRVEVFPDGDRDDDTIVVELFEPYPLVAEDRRPVLAVPSAATVTVRDTVAQETVSIRFGAPAFAVAEGAGSATIEVTRVPSTGGVQVTLGVGAGSAEAGDFEAPASQLLDFPEGTASRTVAITVRADEDSDPEEIDLTLSSPVALSGGVVAVLGTPSSATLTLTDASSPASPSRVSFAVGERRVAEGDGRIRVLLSRVGSQKPAFRARLSVSGSAQAGADFTLAADEVAFAEAQLEASVDLEIVDDRLAEAEEVIDLAISAVEGADVAIGSPARMRLRIAASDQSVALEREGDPPTTAVAGSAVELAVRASRVDGSPASGARVRWSLEAGGGASAELLDGDESVTDDEGRARRTVRFGAGAGEVSVRAALGEPVSAAVVFALAVVVATLPPTPPGVPAAPAGPAIERLCRAEAGSGNPLCDYLFGSGLTATEQLAAVEELSGRESTALGTAALASADEHLTGVRGRLAALRGGASAAAAGEIALQIGARSVSSGVIAGAIDAVARRRRLERRVESRLARAGRGDGASEAAPPPPAVSKPRRWGVFASGRAAFGEKEASEQEPGFEFDAFALTVGLDRRVGDDWVIGAALGVLDAAHALSDGGALDVAARDFTLFGLWQRPSGFYAQASGTWGRNALDLERRVRLPRRAGETASATADGDQLALALELGLGRELGAWSVNGFARASRVAADLDGYRETSTAGAGTVPFAALVVADQGVDSLLTEAGLDLAYTAHLSIGLLRPLLRVSLLHEAEDDARAIRSRLAVDPDPTNTFVVPTDDPDRDWASAGLGLQLYTLRGSFFLLVDRELARSDLRTTRVTLGFRREL